jgi:formate dehydrogenase major subunit
MGSNMAENHPVGFQWVIEARERGARVIHVDPRFTRTSAVAHDFVRIRPGTDIAFLGGVIKYVLDNGLWFDEYVKAYTNASTIVSEAFRDTEDLDGFFSGFQATTKTYDIDSWQYDGLGMRGAAGLRTSAMAAEGAGGAGDATASASLQHGKPPHVDPTLQDPHCVFQLLKRHFARYTPEMVEQICGTPVAEFLTVAQALAENSGRERTTAMCYAVGWTQHTVGVQYIRTAAILQLLLGNIGRPGGGILALRGHASIQGSTDIPTLFDTLPGYIPMPDITHTDLATFLHAITPEAGFWAHMDAYTVSLLKAYYGDHATKDNDFCFDYLPRLTGDHSTYQTILAMLEDKVRGFFVIGENPAVGSANSSLHRRAMAHLDWLVVRDLFEIETAAFWHTSPEHETGAARTEDIKTEVFFLPAADHTEKKGSFTNTQRLLQWRHQAHEPSGDCRSETWFYYELGKRIREKLAHANDPKDRAVLELTWDYPVEGRLQDPNSEAVLQEINGFAADGSPLDGYTQLKADGSTRCGCWIYSGVYAKGKNAAANRTPGSEQNEMALNWGWAWPANRRILYNRASADPSGKPWSERKKLIWFDESKGEWVGDDVPDFVKTKRPDYVPPDGAKAEAAHDGASPFIMQGDGKGWLFAPDGLVDGPLPTHYEPEESPFKNALYTQRASPAREHWPNLYNPLQPVDGDPHARVYPFIATTYRVTEHHTAGGMSRTVPHLAELQPEMFCEVSPALAALRGLENGGWATIVTARSAIEARVLVTNRMRDECVEGRTTCVVGLPYHWGTQGLVTGDSANDLWPMTGDPNVHIGESKATTCEVLAGRRPHGPALTALLNAYRTRAGLANTEN